jgi:hypothetical protein
MRERVALVDGTLTIDSRPGAGTTLTVTLLDQRPALNPTRFSVRGDESDRRFA